MQRYMIAVFDDREHAEKAVADLRAAGIPAEEIGIVAGQHHHRTLIDRLGMSDTPLVTGSNAANQEDHREAAEGGMKIGAGIGAAIGVIAGIGLVAFTGGGAALLVAGPIVGLFAGGTAGAAAGGITGALVGMGLPHDKATGLEEQIHGGAIVVSLRAEEQYFNSIERIFSRDEVQETIVTGIGGAVA